MSTQESYDIQTSEPAGSKQPHVLRGVSKNDTDGYDTNLLLYKGKGDFLRGFVNVNDEKIDVIVHINQRKDSAEKFLTVTKKEGEEWRQIGFGNALTHRKDDKPVYNDEIIFNINGVTLNARVAKSIDPTLHQQLGFTESMKPRPERSDSEKPNLQEQISFLATQLQAHASSKALGQIKTDFKEKFGIDLPATSAEPAPKPGTPPKSKG